MLDWLSSLIDTKGFRPVGAAEGWTPDLIAATQWSNLAIFAAYLSIGVLLVLMGARRVSPRRTVFRTRWLAIAFGTVLLWGGFTHLVRAITYTVPVYRLQVAVNVIAAIYSWLTLGVIVPALLHSEWARRTGLEEDALSRIERVQERLTWREEELNRILAAMDRLPRILEDPPRLDEVKPSAARGEGRE